MIFADATIPPVNAHAQMDGHIEPAPSPVHPARTETNVRTYANAKATLIAIRSTEHARVPTVTTAHCKSKIEIKDCLARRR